MRQISIRFPFSEPCGAEGPAKAGRDTFVTFVFPPGAAPAGLVLASGGRKNSPKHLVERRKHAGFLKRQSQFIRGTVIEPAI